MMTAANPQVDKLLICAKGATHESFADSLRADIADMIIDGVNSNGLPRHRARQ